MTAPSLQPTIGEVMRQDVDGAPVRMGQAVTILGDASNDETADPAFKGRVGRVCGLLYDSPAEDQFPQDPMILVRVEGVGEDLFFAEELDLERWARCRVAQLRRRGQGQM